MVFSKYHIQFLYQTGNVVREIVDYGPLWEMQSALAELEKLPLEQLINHAFGSIFPNMDAKWLRVYERTALYGEMLEIVDFSPEIDTALRIICFPTFKGHCGCILFDQAEIQTVQTGK